MKKLITIILLSLLMYSCSTIGYLEERHEGAVVITNEDGVKELYEIIYFDDNLFIGDLVKINKKKMSIVPYDNNKHIKDVKTLK